MPQTAAMRRSLRKAVSRASKRSSTAEKGVPPSSLLQQPRIVRSAFGPRPLWNEKHGRRISIVELLLCTAVLGYLGAGLLGVLGLL